MKQPYRIVGTCGTPLFTGLPAPVYMVGKIKQAYKNGKGCRIKAKLYSTPLGSSLRSVRQRMVTIRLRNVLFPAPGSPMITAAGCLSTLSRLTFLT
jgi:hypothetical protein